MRVSVNKDREKARRGPTLVDLRLVAVATGKTRNLLLEFRQQRIP